MKCRVIQMLRHNAVKIIWLLSLLSFGPLVDAQMKQWTDENGVIHYGNFQGKRLTEGAPKQVQQAVRCILTLPDPKVGIPDRRFQEIIEKGLATLKRCYSEIDNDYTASDLELQRKAVIEGGEPKFAIGSERISLRRQRDRLVGPLRDSYLLISTEVKNHFGGELPRWFVESRDQIYLSTFLFP